MRQLFTPSKMSLPIDRNLEDINKQILEIKKKIQLSEGQRKAHFEEWDGEKKRNNEKIKQLKKEVKELHLQLANTGQNFDTILRARSKYPKEAGALRNKSAEEVVTLLDCKATDLKKKLDLLRHESTKCQNKMKVLAEQYHVLLHRNGTHAEKPEVCSLENQIHRVEMNLMEAEHVKKKYRVIRGSLLEDGVAFESTLIKIEEAIKKQEAEIRQLKDVHSEALGLRDATRTTLTRQELNAVNAAKTREKELQDLRYRVEERRLELERLERRIFPAGRSLLHQDSTSSLEQAESAADDSASKGTRTRGRPRQRWIDNVMTDVREFGILNWKEKARQTDSEDVLKRFLSQKDTLSRLSYLRTITEEEKQELLKKRDYMMAELEAFKFAEVKDTEQNADESDRVKQDIGAQEERKRSADEEAKEMQQQLYKIRDILRSFCVKLEKSSGITAPQERRDLGNVDDILKTLEDQARNIMDRIGTGDEFDKHVLHLQGKETDDEDEVPSRGFLKRQAQIIVDAKSRRKQFPMSVRSKKTLTIK
ncbi:hypothetical protein C0J52_03936 [Blattella germanica]|nr:hypothetical protein C0J52_03936 [Blattella germanica]